MTLIAPDGFVNLSPSRLSLLECPRRGKYLLEMPRREPTVPLRLGLAAHAVLASLCRRGWPDDAFDLVPGLARIALRSEWPAWASDPASFDGALADLTGLLRQFLFAWTPPPAAASPSVETWAEFEHRGSRLRITGRLDLLIPPQGGQESWMVVVDYKSGRQGLDATVDQATPPLPVIAQAVLARARLGVRSPVEVRLVFLRTNGEEIWSMDREALTNGWKRLRALAADVLADRWPAVPGGHCERCRGVECEWAPRSLDAQKLSLVDDLETDSA